MIQSWPGSTSAIREIFNFFGVPFRYEHTKGTIDIGTYIGVVGDRQIKLSTTRGDETQLGIQVMPLKDEYAVHGVILQHCIKIDIAERENGRKSVKIYTFGGEIDLR